MIQHDVLRALGYTQTFRPKYGQKNRTGSSKPAASKLFVWNCCSVISDTWYLMNPCIMPGRLLHLICVAAILSHCVLCLALFCLLFLTVSASLPLLSLLISCLSLPSIALPYYIFCCWSSNYRISLCLPLTMQAFFFSSQSPGLPGMVNVCLASSRG